MKRTVIVDYGMGNLRSVEKAFEACGDRPIVSSKPSDVEKAARLVLPGVGAFGQAMRELRRLKLVDPLRKKIKSGSPYLGICLGLQLLFESSEENRTQKGLGIFAGRVRRFSSKMRGGPASGRKARRLKVPHIGWNEVSFNAACPIFKTEPQDAFFYFVHSYFADPEDPALVAGRTRYGTEFCSAIWQNKIFATQFHPEKSQRLGLKLIQNFLTVKA